MYIEVEQKYRLLIGLLFSLIIHILFFTIFPSKINPIDKGVALNRPLPVRSIEPVELEKYRQVGTPDGVKDSSIPLHWGPKPSPLSLKDITPRSSDTDKIQATALNKRGVKQAETEDSNEHSPGRIAILHQADFYINFSTPQGVSEDELNSAEKIFWSFKKRVSESFASSLLKTYRRFLLERPQIVLALRDARHYSTVGRAIFDQEGNTLRIRIVQPSTNDHLQALFEETLKNIGRLPNPPQGLLVDNELTLYYKLTINP